jgi:four helix bundle protein
MHNFKELKVWKESMELARKIYKVTKLFPNEEKFGMTSQLRRCSVSIPSNIAEGCGRNSNKEFGHFLNISIGSSYELETQILLATDFEYLTIEQSNE